MVSRPAFVLIVCCLSFGTSAVPVRGDEDAPLPPDAPDNRVMVIKWDVELKSGQTVVTRVPLGAVLEFSETNGPWKWIAAAKGWINETDVVPVGKAIQHFDARVKNEPSSQTFHERGIARVALGQHEAAIEDFSEAIKREDSNLAAVNDRGIAHRHLGNADAAIADFTRVIDGDVKHPGVFVNRGLARQTKGMLDMAIDDFDAAIQIDPKFAPAWEAGGSARYESGDFTKAYNNYRKAIEIDPNFARALNNLAWMLAVCPDEHYLDGAEAVRLATKACQLAEFQDAGFLDTLAAAHAENGQFEQAVIRAKEAIEKADDKRKSDIRERLQGYEAGKPYRQPPVARGV